MRSGRNCAFTDVIEDGERIQGVRYTDPDGAERHVFGTYVVDASGNTSRIHKRVGGSRTYSEFFRSLALFGYFEAESGSRHRMPATFSRPSLAAGGSGTFR